MYEIRDTYTECNECIKKYKNELSEMMSKLSKQNELRKSNESGLLSKKGQKLLIGNPPALYGLAGSIDVEIVNFQNEDKFNIKEIFNYVFG